MRTITAAVLACVLAFVASPPASAAAPADDRAARTAADLPDPAPPGDRVTFYALLHTNEAAARRALRAVSDPSSPRYRHFLSRAAIRDRFGAPPRDVAALLASARGAGLRAALDRTGVAVRVSGTVAAMSAWIGTPIRRQVATGDGVTIQVYTTGPSAAVPPAVRPAVRYLQASFTRLTAAPAGRSARSRPLPGNTGTWVGGCDEARTANVYSFDQLMKAYGYDTLPRGRANGRATRLAIISAGEGYSDAALAASAECFERPGRTFRRVSIPGFDVPLPEGVEGDLDTQIAQAVLPPGSEVTVVEGDGVTRIDSYWVAWAKAYALPKLPDVVTMSYVGCEPYWLTRPGGREQMAAMNAVLVRFGLAGTTGMVASGDFGSAACFELFDMPDRAVEFPASSPYVTAVGGSQIVLNAGNTRRAERAWRDVDRYDVIDGMKVPTPDRAGGGGSSLLFARPWYQPPAAGAARSVPDLALHASFGPGWPVYMVSTGGMPGFYGVAGTSAASPFFASGVAVVAAAQRRAGQPGLGFLNPLLYRLWQRHPRTFFDITAGTNDMYGNGCCRARTGYDQATGVGAPRFAVWPKLVPPAARRGNG